MNADEVILSTPTNINQRCAVHAHLLSERAEVTECFPLVPSFKKCNSRAIKMKWMREYERKVEFALET